ncbi:hypothetical protein B0H66DRAFT_397155 [Apodospora peruviana]|uniref:Ankyrin repeat containing protein n=1 Tax=Apodospora peruviana TaxID=516989 RepID=A0AAE0LYG6_9PEZI|nr:hypothetical protein B0H66DRAFT_397155 [Apodospora peruviana]
MASSPRREARRRRLHQLAAEWGVGNPPPLPPLTPDVSSPLSPTTFRTSNDEFLAEELLRRQRMSAAADRNSQGGIKRAFTTNKKAWEAKEIFDALEAHVSNCGAPGVADALIAKLKVAGGNPNVLNVKNKTGLLNRRKSIESMERSRILQKAIETRHIEMVTVLVQHADPLTLDAALPLAMQSGDGTIVHLLLQRGANASQTTEAQDVFRQLCMHGGHADMVGLILQSEGRPPPESVSMAMVDATRKGCFDTVLRLSRSTADGGYQNAEALRTAIDQGRVDIALGILTGARPPSSQGQGLMECFTQLHQHAAIRPIDKLALTEALLCSGATGDPVSIALSQACLTEFYDMVNLLVSYGASVEYQDANIVRHTISRGQTSLVQLLLNEQSTLSSIYASECVGHIPKSIAPEDRHALLSILLQKGAGGVPLSDALIDAVEACDLQSIELLVTPQFPEGRLVSSPSQSSRGMVFDRHEVASVDHKSGQALSIAVMTCNLPMLKLLLAGKPSIETLAQLFPQINTLSTADRYYMAECFLSAGLTGPTVSAALEDAIEEEPPRRDENYINLLLRHNADINFNDGAGILSAITHRDLGLLDAMLKNRPSPQTSAAAIAKAMIVEDRPVRYEMVRLLIEAGAGRVGSEVSEALVQLLPVKPLDMQLAALLLERGRADANFKEGLPVALAANDPNPTILEIVCQHGKPTPKTLFSGLTTLAQMPTNPAKAAKVISIVRRTKQQEALNNTLYQEVQTVLKSPLDNRNLAVVKLLLSAGADVNAYQGGALQSAVAAADPLTSDLLFNAHPNSTSISGALPHSLHILDPMDRLSFTQKLIAAGAPPAEINRALIYAIEAHPTDLPLLALLAAHADSTDGKVLKLAVNGESVDAVDLILAKSPSKYSASVLQDAFQEATKVKDKGKRVAICSLLLKKGVSGQIVSDALLTASTDGDVLLGAVLMDHGASVEHQEGQAIVEACTAGASEVLRMLLRSKAEVRKQTLVKGFQAATQVGDLGKRGEVFRILLDNGVSGDVVNAQLVSAAKFGEDGESLVRLFLEFGANVDYNSGEAIWNATRGAIMGSLRLMLGVDRVGEKQTRPSTATLLRALKASRKLSRDPRYQVIEWLFEAGLPACEEIHIALNRAVKDDPDVRLIRLLLKNGASPLVNGCESLIDAAQLFFAEVLGVFLESDIPQKDISWAFKQAFTPETASTWLSEQGFQVATMLLGKGAEGGSLSLALSAAIDHYGSDNDDIARQFADLLLHSKADVDYQDGLVVQKAAKSADSKLIQQVLDQKPNSRSVSIAFPHIFGSGLSEEDTLGVMTLFTEYHDGEERLDAMFVDPSTKSEPVMFRALAEFPRSVKILQGLIDAGYYHDQMTMMRAMEDIEEEEQVSLLFWALSQPQKRISSAVIELLVNRGAKVNFETRISKTTPLMLAIQHRRPDLVKTLILAGAEVDVPDITGNTPMTMATKIGGDLGTGMMTSILAADPSKNDGSLHNAARELNLRAMQVLIDYGHDVDFPSDLHGGRSALGELCLNAAHAGPFSATQVKLMEKAMALLIESGTDLTIQSDGKSVLLLALHSDDPVPTTRALLKVGMWKHINRLCNHFTDGTYTYSASQYVARVLPASDAQPQLLELLKANRATDVFYANDGPQPEGAVNLPEELLRAERERRAYMERIAKESEEHTHALARTKEIAQIQNQIFKARAELEDSRARRQREEEISGIRQRQVVEEEAFAAELSRRRKEREAALAHERQLIEAGLTRARLVSEAELEMEEKKQGKMIEWDQRLGVQRVENARQLSDVEVRKREALERLEATSDARTVKRIGEQRKLVDSQNALAGRLTSAGVTQRRQIGYITGELD